MPPSLGQPLTRITLHLFAKDAELLRRRYGQGWTAQVRRMVAENCKEYRRHRAKLTELDHITEECTEQLDED